mgnify:CR=1 FL=1
MNLSFSTRGWPGLTWDDMIETALEMGFTGIEVYNADSYAMTRPGPRLMEAAIGLYEFLYGVEIDETAIPDAPAAPAQTEVPAATEVPAETK